MTNDQVAVPAATKRGSSSSTDIDTMDPREFWNMSNSTALGDRTSRAVCLIAAAMMLSLPIGCAEMDLTEDLGWLGMEPEPQTPSRVTDMWNYTVLRQPGKVGVRGFGGRLMFFVEGDHQPVTVDGTVTVYAFEAPKVEVQNAKPEKKFVFLPDQLPKHYSKTKLGHSYSFWIPWDEVGGPQREVVLVTRFESSTGETIVAEESRQTLPGVVTEQAQPPIAHWPVAVPRLRMPRQHPAHQQRIEQVSHVAAEPPDQRAADRNPANPANPANPGNLGTTTIDVPPSFAREVLAVRPGDATQRPMPTQLFPAQRPAAHPANVAPDGGYPPPVTPIVFQPPATPPEFPPEFPQAAPSVGFPRSRFPARRAATFPPASDPVRREPHRVSWPSRLPPTPRFGYQTGQTYQAGSAVPDPAAALDPY